MDPVSRQAARLLVIDQENNVLLFQYTDEGRAWWAMPGGGLEGDETFEQAAMREATEELALTHPALMPLGCRTVEFAFRGQSIRQLECYFMTRLRREDIALDGIVANAHRIEGIVAARWWPLEEIETTAQQVFPEDLCERVRSLQ